MNSKCHEEFTNKPLFLFDGDCGLCQWASEKLQKINQQKKVNFLSYQSFSDKELESYGLNKDQCHQALQWIGANKKVYSGPHAINRFLWEYWPWKVFVFYSYCFFPLILFEILIYPLIAKNRQKISKLLGLNACKIS